MPEILNKHKLGELLNELQQIPEEIWGFYQFRRDLFWKKTSLSKQRILIQQSIDCGIEMACGIKKKCPFVDVEEICEQMAVPIISCESEQMNERITFTAYVGSEKIRLITEPLEKLRCSELTSISKETTQASIIGHELFHHIEAFVKGIYAQDEKIVLWRLPFYTHQSNIRALSEITATSFSEEVSQNDFSPYVLETVLLWLHNEIRSQGILEEIKKIEKRCTGYDLDYKQRDYDKSRVTVLFFRISDVLLSAPRSQVKIFSKHEKLFFETVPCDSEMGGRLTTSWKTVLRSLHLW